MKRLWTGIKDDEFIRGKVPMTKQEVRVLSLSKLRLEENSIVYDIGSGTGSVSIEMAMLSDSIQVYAIECNEEANVLLRENMEKFKVSNITNIESLAPTGIDSLPIASHSFIGGSKGHLKEILSCLYQKNSNMRIVINAITLESICEVKECMNLFPITDAEITQVQISKSKVVGAYHLMQANNPVYIFSFTFKEEVCIQE